jgi:ribosomal-protein-alanine N-acetyltransferase
MNVSILPEIETERLLLRQVIPNDLEKWANGFFADPDAMRYMPRREITPLARAQRGMNNFNRYWTQHGLGAWGITDKKDGQFLGTCYFEPPEDSGTGEVELGYDLVRAFWGQGIATEAARAAVHFSFDNNKLERIAAIVVPENIGSWRVLEHIGFVYEKNAHIYDVDVVYYAITREQFQPGDSFYHVHVPKP